MARNACKHRRYSLRRQPALVLLLRPPRCGQQVRQITGEIIKLLLVRAMLTRFFRPITLRFSCLAPSACCCDISSCDQYCTGNCIAVLHSSHHHAPRRYFSLPKACTVRRVKPGIPTRCMFDAAHSAAKKASHQQWRARALARGCRSWRLIVGIIALANGSSSSICG